jgi:hypothetical protein
MKLLILNIIAFIIAASSLHQNFRSEMNSSEYGSDVISSIRSLDIDTIRVTSEKRYQQIEASFVPLVAWITLRETENRATIPFQYYLTTYSLIRLKEFFLLI